MMMLSGLSQSVYKPERVDVSFGQVDVIPGCQFVLTVGFQQWKFPVTKAGTIVGASWSSISETCYGNLIDMTKKPSAIIYK